MTTQNINASVSTRSRGWTFSTTGATDGQWTSMTSDEGSSSQMGILIPGQTIDTIQANYVNGVQAIRIQDAITLAVKYRGLGSAAGYNWYPDQQITPLRIGPNDQLQSYTQPEDAVAGQANVIAWVKTNKGMELMESLAVPDSTDTEMITAINGVSLGDAFFGTTLQSVMVQVEDAGSLSAISIVDEAGGEVIRLYGGQRGVTPGQQSLSSNGIFENLSIPVGRGWQLKVKTISA